MTKKKPEAKFLKLKYAKINPLKQTKGTTLEQSRQYKNTVK